MSVFSSPSFDHHELVSFRDDPKSGLRAIIAVHNSHLGPAVGGCRMFPYASDAQALEDVLRLSRGMTYKSALAGLPMGGGKAVIIGDPKEIKSEALLAAMGQFIDSLGGRYVTAEDSGTSVEDMRVMQKYTKHVSGVDDSQQFGGDPSPFTALGIYHGIKSAVQHKLEKSDLNGVSVAIQGAGSVGLNLIQLLMADNAKVVVADIDGSNLDKAHALGAKIVGVNNILEQEVDVLSPCAMGGVINDKTIGKLRTSIIAGGANNQLLEERHGELLNEQNILYAPDFVINAGGIIEIHHQLAGTSNKSKAHVTNIGNTLDAIFSKAKQSGKSTLQVAEEMAREKFNVEHKPSKKITVEIAA